MAVVALMTGPLRVSRSTIGKKAVLAVTGFVLVVFVVFHMAANLKIYSGALAYNEYAAFLRTVGAPALGPSEALWAARVVLIVCVVLHIVAAAQLTWLARRARPARYALKQRVQATWGSWTMRWTGVLILAFVIFHIMHFTVGTVGYAPGQFLPGDVYHDVVTAFSRWPIAVGYIVAMLALGLHLRHAVWSMFQSLGLNSWRYDGSLRGLAVVVTVVTVLGFISIPVVVLGGLLR